MAHPSLFRRAVLLTTLSLSNWLHAKVGPMDFSTLVRVSDAIVLGRVVDVSKVKGVKIAQVKVLETYKGRKVDELFLLAQATWTCDISEAVKGETALWFLRQ